VVPPWPWSWTAVRGVRAGGARDVRLAVPAATTRGPGRDAWPCPARAAGQATNRTCRAHAAGRKRLVGHRTSASARGCCRGGIKPALGADLGLPEPARRRGRTWFAPRRATRPWPAVARARPAARRATRPWPAVARARPAARRRGPHVVCCPPGNATRTGRRSGATCCPPGNATRLKRGLLPAGQRDPGRPSPRAAAPGLRVQRDAGPRPVAPSAAWTSTSSAPPPR
jgi:hypothetical protein